MSTGGEKAGQRLGFGCLALFGLPFLAATPGVDFSAEFDLPVFAVENESLIERRAPERGGQ